MTDDIVARLRVDWSKGAVGRHFDEDILLDAADEIERLREHSRLRGLDIIELGQMVGWVEVENERLREALRIIAKSDTQAVALNALYPNTDRKATVDR